MNEQSKLSENTEKIGLSINEASEKTNVSLATIRNWIKTGYLAQLSNGLISIESFEDFLHNVAGTKKLNSRANKSQKDNHNHDQLTNNLLSELKSGSIKLNYIGDIYEKSLSNSYRNKEGIYYTPMQIIKDLLKDFQNIEKRELLFCDPSCGSGNFLIEALEIGFKPENVFGFDTDPLAIEISKQRIKAHTGYEGNNIQNTDFLKFAINHNTKYDFIFTNPPWGKKISQKEKYFFSDLFNTGNCPDTSVLFFITAIKCLNSDGFIGFLLPEAFFNIAAFAIAREYALKHSIMRLVDYGKAFEGLVSKAQALVLKKVENTTNKVLCDNGRVKFFREQKTFKQNPKSILNFYCSDLEAKIIEHIFSIKHTTLACNAKWGLGIVTGNNAKFRLAKLQAGYMPVYKGSDITKEGLKEPSIFIPKDTSLYQQVAPLELYEAEEKLIYKFISSKLCFYCDTKKNYILNSANMVILDKNFLISSNQVAELLNSEIINWVFAKIFNTHKILRGDIEILPIHYEYFFAYSSFSEESYLEYLQISRNENGTYRINSH